MANNTEGSQHLCFCVACGHRGLIKVSSDSFETVEGAPFDENSFGELLSVSVIKRCSLCTDGRTYKLSVEDWFSRIRVGLYLSAFVQAAVGVFNRDDDQSSERCHVFDDLFSPKTSVDNIVMDSDQRLRLMGDDMKGMSEDVKCMERRVSWHWAQCVKNMFCVERFLGNGNGVSDGGNVHDVAASSV